MQKLDPCSDSVDYPPTSQSEQKASGSTLDERVSRVFWTDYESSLLREKMKEYKDVPKQDALKYLQQDLANAGCMKTVKQIRQRWDQQDDPNIIKRISPKHAARIVILVEALHKKWAEVARVIKEYNAGFHYSDNTIKNFFNSAMSRSKYDKYFNEVELLKSRYAHLSQDEMIEDIARSLQLDKPQESMEVFPDFSSVFEEEEELTDLWTDPEITTFIPSSFSKSCIEDGLSSQLYDFETTFDETIAEIDPPQLNRKRKVANEKKTLLNMGMPFEGNDQTSLRKSSSFEELQGILLNHPPLCSSPLNDPQASGGEQRRSGSSLDARISRTYWTDKESVLLREKMEAYKDESQRNALKYLQQDLSDVGSAKTVKQISQRWKQQDNPNIIKRISPKHTASIIILAETLHRKWAQVIRAIKKYNSGRYYSENAIRSFFHAAISLPKHSKYLNEVDLLKSQYAHLSEEEMVVQMATSLQLDKPEDLVGGSSDYSSGVDLQEELLNGIEMDCVFPSSLEDSCIKEGLNREFHDFGHIFCETIDEIDPPRWKGEKRLASDLKSSSSIEIPVGRTGQISSIKSSSLEELQEEVLQHPSRSSNNKRRKKAPEDVFYEVFSSSKDQKSGRWNADENKILHEVMADFDAESLRDRTCWSRISDILKSKGVLRSASQVKYYWKNGLNPYVIRSIVPEHRAKIACLIQYSLNSWEDKSKYIAKLNDEHYYSWYSIRDLTRLINYPDIVKESALVWQTYNEIYGANALKEIIKSLELHKLGGHIDVELTQLAKGDEELSNIRISEIDTCAWNLDHERSMVDPQLVFPFFKDPVVVDENMKSFQSWIPDIDSFSWDVVEEDRLRFDC